eukprot:m.232238 g.232238  ORF g.232238 m.232238 type:complete len:570 (-) comp33616_c4_seq9:127-1836(-)
METAVGRSDAVQSQWLEGNVHNGDIVVNKRVFVRMGYAAPTSSTTTIVTPPSIGDLSATHTDGLAENTNDAYNATFDWRWCLEWWCCGCCCFGFRKRSVVVSPPHRLERLALTVDVSSQRLTIFPSQLMERPFCHAHTLLMGNNQIDNESFPDSNVMALFVNLRELDLGGNRLTSVPEGICGGCANLEVFQISGNSITVVPDILAQLTALKILDLSYNKIRELPPCIGTLLNLETLKVQETQLQMIPSCVALLPRLKVFLASNLVFRSLRNIEETAGAWPRLLEFDLCYNQMSSLPQMLSGLPHLQLLRVDHNQIVQLPSDLGDLQNLRVLRADKNLLSTLPPSMSQLRCLVVLDLDHNQIDRLPEDLCGLTNLQTLSLAQNRLTCLPLKFHLLRSLTHLELKGNPELTQLPVEFGRVRQLTTIGLTGTGITSLPLTFGFLRRLESLELVGTGLQGVSYNPRTNASLLVDAGLTLALRRTWRPAWHSLYPAVVRTFMLNAVCCISRFLDKNNKPRLEQLLWMLIFKCLPANQMLETEQTDSDSELIGEESNNGSVANHQRRDLFQFITS